MVWNINNKAAFMLSPLELLYYITFILYYLSSGQNRTKHSCHFFFSFLKSAKPKTPNTFGESKK